MTTKIEKTHGVCSRCQLVKPLIKTSKGGICLKCYVKGKKE